MSFRDILSENIQSAHFLLTTYLSDFSDQDLLKRPVPNANHTAWQLGHLIISTNGMLNGINAPGVPTLPDGFEAAHKKDKASENDAAKFFSKEQYLNLFAQQKACALSVIATIDESELDKPGPEAVRAYCPTVRSVLLLSGSHITMHIGQFVVSRRSLGKPILM